MRSNTVDPLGRVGFKRHSAVNYSVGKRKVEGRRQWWLLYTSRYAWGKIEGETFEFIVEHQTVRTCIKPSFLSAIACPLSHPCATRLARSRGSQKTRRISILCRTISPILMKPKLVSVFRHKPRRDTRKSWNRWFSTRISSMKTVADTLSRCV